MSDPLRVYQIERARELAFAKFQFRTSDMISIPIPIGSAIRAFPRTEPTFDSDELLGGPEYTFDMGREDYMHDAGSGSRMIQVSRAKLLETLAVNREKHAKKYAEAVEGWRQAIRDKGASATEIMLAVAQVTDVRDAKRKLAELNGDLNALVNPPESHVAEYERAAELLSWEERDSILISQGDFARFVKDEWDWSRGFRQQHETFSSFRRA